jgi:hypothetical protein
VTKLGSITIAQRGGNLARKLLSAPFSLTVAGIGIAKSWPGVNSAEMESALKAAIRSADTPKRWAMF